VEAALALASEKMWQPIEGNKVLQLWK
jgi:hypothetical protein